MLNLGFRAHDFGKFDSAHKLAETASSFRSPNCLHFAPYKVLSEVPKPLTCDWAYETSNQLSVKKVSIAILGCYINPMHPDSDRQETELKSFENGIDIAHCLGNPVVATETGSLNASNVRCEETYTEKSFSHFLSNIERLLNHSVKNNVVMAIEAVADKNTIDTPQRMMKVMETFKSPNLRVLFDAVNILPIHGVSDYTAWYDEALDMLSPYICAMHIKDFNWVDTSKEFPFSTGPVKNGNLPVGEGLFPWKDIMKLYKKYNLLEVPMTLENFNPNTLFQSLTYIESCLN